ncbi:VCBS repeat-containing protein [Verrucomicrobiaceae bacterium 227]
MIKTSLFRSCGWLPTALTFALPMSLVTPVEGVINAGLQPCDLYETRYSRVLALEIMAIDPARHSLKCRVVKTIKGKPEASPEVNLQFDAALADVLESAMKDGDIKVGDPVAVFAGRKRATNDFMLYANSFYLGEIKEPGVWKIDETGQGVAGVNGEQLNTLAGTWNGATPRLIDLLDDVAAGRDHFPRKAYVRFKEDILLDQLDAPVSAVSVFDLEGDGDEDIIACSAEGDRIYLQTDPMVFVNATTNLGLDSRSTSCALADANGDGLNDLLAGAVLYQGQFLENRFTLKRTDWLPDSLAVELKTATFVDLNSDGYPDVLASVTGKGLKTFLNPGEKGGKFVETTSAMGLDQAQCGAGADGFVTPGDWNNDGRMDLFLAAGKGFLLLQNESGKFAPKDHGVEFKFTSGPEDNTGLTGAGVFLPIIQNDHLDLVVPMEESWLVIANNEGEPEDVTRWGNEISEGSNNHLSTIGDDWNLDGHLDFFTVSRAENGHNRYIVNRGYGSFMLAPVHKHYEHVFKGPSSERGGWSSASGDLNDDGAPDLVVGNGHGEVTLILNDTLEVRKPIDHPQREVEVLENTHLLQVRVLGPKGVTNARLRLLDESGRVIGRRDLGSNVSGGSCGSHRVTFAVRNPGICQLEVRYSDGLERKQKVDLTKEQRVSINVERGEKSELEKW